MIADTNFFFPLNKENDLKVLILEQASENKRLLLKSRLSYKNEEIDTLIENIWLKSYPYKNVALLVFMKLYKNRKGKGLKISKLKFQKLADQTTAKSHISSSKC